MKQGVEASDGEYYNASGSGTGGGHAIMEISISGVDREKGSGEKRGSDQ